MGSILAVLGQAPSEASDAVTKMAKLRPGRGELSVFSFPYGAVGFQQRRNDVVFFQDDRYLLLVQGAISGWGSYSSKGLRGNDAEKLAALLCDYSLKAVLPQLGGQFSVLLLDKVEQAVIVAKDLGATHPLYHAANAQKCVIGSEIRQVLLGADLSSEVDRSVAVHWLVFYGDHVDMNRTLYAGVSRVLGGQMLELTALANGIKPQYEDYWAPPKQQNAAFEVESSLASTYEHLYNAVDAAIPQQGRYAVGLSGGIDSSAIWGLAHEVEKARGMTDANRFSITNTYPGLPCDERAYVEENLALHGGTPIWLDVSERRTSSDLAWFLEHSDPLPAGLVTGYEAYFAALGKHEIDCLFMGDGADILFHRSPWYLLSGTFWHGSVARAFRCMRYQHSMFGGSGFRGFVKMLIPQWLMGMRGQHLPWIADIVADDWVDELRRELSRQVLQRAEYARERKGVASIWGFVRRGGFAEGFEPLCMGQGIALKSPFLDADFVRHSLALSDEIACHGDRFKGFLRDALKPLLPESVYQMPKVSFESFLSLDGDGWKKDPLPLEEWILFSGGFLDQAKFKKAYSSGVLSDTLVADYIYPLELRVRSFC